jgi:hypothetical protein
LATKFTRMPFDERMRFVALYAMTWPSAWLAVRTELYHRRRGERQGCRLALARGARARVRRDRGLPVLRRAAKAKAKGKGKAKAKAKANPQPNAPLESSSDDSASD